LSYGNISLICERCKITFEVKFNVPCFLKENRSWGIGADEKFKDFNEYAERKGWRKAVSRFFWGTYNYSWIVDNYRANGVLILADINEQSVILDAGCGPGVISFALSEICKEVHALDASFEFVRFVSIRSKQDGVENVFPVHGELGQLPFPSGYFDLVIVNGVLEWVPFYYQNGDPMDVQSKVLREINRVLRPNGQIYIGIENRFGFQYLLGAKDEHTLLRYITVMPRQMANLYSQIVRGKPYRTYTHSYRGLLRLLKRSGFVVKRAYMPLPNYRDVRILVDLMDPCRVAFFVGRTKYISDSSSFRLIVKNMAKMGVLLGLHRLKLHRIFSPAFSIVGRKE